LKNSKSSWIKKLQKCYFQIFNCQKRKKRIWGISKRQRKSQRIRESRDIERERGGGGGRRRVRMSDA
jgi:hypothetical protein